MAADPSEKSEPRGFLTSAKSSLKWLYPGMRVKRWLLLVPVGLAFVILGVGILTNLRTFDYMAYLDDLARQAFLRFGIILSLPKDPTPVYPMLCPAVSPSRFCRPGWFPCHFR